MTQSKRFTKPRILIFSLLAAIVIAINVYWACITYTAPVINVTFILEFIVSPIILILLIALVTFLNKKVSVKILCSILVFVLIWLSFFAYFLFGNHEDLAHYENEDVSDHYSEVTKDFKEMPYVSELGEFNNIEYYSYMRSLSVFLDESETLICKYDKDEYQKQKKLLEENYVFQSEPLTAVEHTCEPEVTIDGYRFRMVEIDTKNSFIFPKSMMFIATNDDTNEIVYMACENMDVDYIDSLAEFINLNCGWKRIR